MFIYSQLLNVQLFDMLFVTKINFKQSSTQESTCPLWGTVLMVGATVDV